jgi:hypothetical protein
MITREQAMQYLRYAVDDSLSERNIVDMPETARFVVYLCGENPVTVAVWSYLPDTRLNEMEAEELAVGLLNEHAWFGSVVEHPIADFVI